MKKILFAACCLLAGGLHAANTATQTLTFSVSAINELSVSGNPAAFAVTSATAGSDPSAVNDTSTSYAVTTNQSNQKITAALNTAMPSGTSMHLTLGAPTGATSSGSITLTTTATNVVTGISTLAQAGNAITYSFAATSAAGQISSTTRTVTLTLTAGP